MTIEDWLSKVLGRKAEASPTARPKPSRSKYASRIIFQYLNPNSFWRNLKRSSSFTFLSETFDRSFSEKLSSRFRKNYPTPIRAIFSRNTLSNLYLRNTNEVHVWVSCCCWHLRLAQACQQPKLKQKSWKSVTKMRELTYTFSLTLSKVLRLAGVAVPYYHTVSVRENLKV